ncbi:major capsid protein [Wielerella bovis]|uniref:major capsid protein n=1 Tax=Wielerella bovis TaxID=2917790 RepID=UPI002019017A|nr:major capsid protein [Wielerella bovis]MCG7655939.1 major capsid protein [Wielerella bovis]MCG7658144.1 major capsid protein [Wielerella bovis]MCG7658187.1 major capsid protein [Wielerella bovis]
MPLSDTSKFSMQAMTEAVNLLPATATQIRGLNLFKPKMHSTTYVTVEMKDGVLTLVQTSPRGNEGTASQVAKRSKKTFEIPHLVRTDFIRADEVQNVHEFGNPNKAQAVDNVVLERLETMKGDIGLTQEHLMLGALLGDIKDADGTTLYNLYKEFGEKRNEFNWKLNVKTTPVGALMDDAKRQIRKNARGEIINGFIALCSPEFFDQFKYHDSIKDNLIRHREAAAYREDTGASLTYNGIEFVEYYGDFGGKAAKIEAGSAILLPKGTRNTFVECFAPADTNSAVNTLAQPMYAQREKLGLDKGWKLEVQSNPLPLCLRLNLVATLKAE